MTWVSDSSIRRKIRGEPLAEVLFVIPDVIIGNPVFFKAKDPD